ncbi:MAG: aminodeoxychorismate/anthranilate synthase component II [Saprospiraceae bacterium]|nr:aminodeoxychorismate/anthranilate synthase component II [Saprospiraceae bacterium]
MGKKILLIDNYDSFTYNLYDYIHRAGALSCNVIRNDDAQLHNINIKNYDGVILSPGPSRPHDANYLMEYVNKWKQCIPMLGVCLGHQALGLAFGATLNYALKPIHGKVSMITHDGSGLFEGIESPMQVMRYHSLIIERTELSDLEVTSMTNEGEIMSMKHKHLPVWGVQFHPESILTPQGIKLLSNWLKLI